MSPPVRKRACRSMNVLPRSEAAVSKLPGQPPRVSAKAIAGGSRRTTVVPLRTARSWAWPTRTPFKAVRVRFAAGIASHGRAAAERARAIKNPRGVLSRELLDPERDAAGLELGEQGFERELLDGQDTGPRHLPADQQGGRRRDGSGGDVPFRRRPAPPVRLA